MAKVLKKGGLSALTGGKYGEVPTQVNQCFNVLLSFFLLPFVLLHA